MPAADRSKSVLAGRQVGRGSGVYLAPVPGESAPRRIVVDGKRLTRFMDAIYLDRPCEKLDLKKIQILTEVRRPLIDRCPPTNAVNVRVRTAFARGVDVVRPGTVLEWGCGYHPLHELLGVSGYAGVDIDPAVIAHNRERHPAASWFEADRDLADFADGSQDVIVSAFVFHFRLSRIHVATMRRMVKPTGIVLANVYRRSSSSRRELASRFEQVGFRVHRERDVAELCADHEFWCLTPEENPDPDITDRVLNEVAIGIAAGAGAPGAVAPIVGDSAGPAEVAT